MRLEPRIKRCQKYGKAAKQKERQPQTGTTAQKDGHISLYLEYYLGRIETPVVD